MGQNNVTGPPTTDSSISQGKYLKEINKYLDNNLDMITHVFQW